MNIWDHSRISVRKFGGKELDYFAIHKFIDSSKLFYFHVKHRLLLHNLYGIELSTRKFGDLIKNSDDKTILVRDVVAEHLKEDLSGKVPSINDWLKNVEEELAPLIQIPQFQNKELEEFVLLPFLMSNLKASLFITLSEFGIQLTNDFLGLEEAKELAKKTKSTPSLSFFLEKYRFTERWQYSPDVKELEWLKNNKNG